MGDYDYMNARIRSKSTELLSRSFFENLLGGGDESILVDALLNSAYGEEVRSALSVTEGFSALKSAVGRHVHTVYSFLLEVAPESPRHLIETQLAAWELHNVLAILRGKVRRLPSEEILRATFPVASLGEPALRALAEEPDAPSAVNTLATWGYDFAGELRKLFANPDGEVDLRQADHQAHAAFFTAALATFSGIPDSGPFGEQMARQIDLFNVKRVLDVVRRNTRGEDVEPVEPVAGGRIPSRVLLSMADAEDFETAFELLDGTYFTEAVERGILAFGERGNLSAMERFLEAVVIEEGCSYFRKDPLSATVPLGFLWLQYNELVNLRILLRGREHHVPPAAIREELLLV